MAPVVDEQLKQRIQPRHKLRYWMGWSYMQLAGWRFEGEFPPDKKYVLISAPHTSNWDLPHMLAVSYVLDLELSWLGKHHIFKGPGGKFFSWLGGIPVNRSAPQGLVQQVIDVFHEREELVLSIPPEGTRGKVDGWKTGFYYIALGAGVPIVPGYLDFENQVAGFYPHFHPTGDIEKDFEHLHALYDGIQGKHPERMSEVKIRPKRQYEDNRERKKTPLERTLSRVERLGGLLRRRKTAEG